MFWSILNLASEIFKFLKTQLGATRLRVLFSDSLLENSKLMIANGWFPLERVGLFEARRGMYPYASS
jgi:hypothetical protein